MKSEAPMKVSEYRAKYRLGKSAMCAIRRAMAAPAGGRYLIESEVNRWRREHLDHRQTDIYPKKETK